MNYHVLGGLHEVTLTARTCDSVTVVICAYTKDRWPTLRRALDVALQQIGPRDELLVVVDYNDALLARCRESSDRFKVLPNRGRRGLSGARNTALAEAAGSIIVCAAS